MNKVIVIGLLICIAISAYLRVFLPYEQVFTGEYINFTTNDAYWHMAQVDIMAQDFPAFSMFADTAGTPYHMFYPWFISGVAWLAGLGSPTQALIDTVGAYVPAILGVLTIIPVFFTAQALSGSWAGIIAAGMISILPGEWLARSSLGFTDHHVMEVFLSSLVLLFLVLVFKSKGKRVVLYSLGALFCFWFYYYTWSGGALLAFIVVSALVAIAILNPNSSIIYMAMIASLTIILVIPLPTDAIYSVLQGPTAFATSELQRLSIGAAWSNFGFCLFFAPLAMGAAIKQAITQKDKALILFIVWSIVMLAAALLCRRFSYYLAVNVAVLMGWAVAYVWRGWS